jgi:DNA-binding winged helix-turn-helix (wHTH) protein
MLDAVVHAFRGCELDEELYQLRRNGAAVKLENKAFDVLLYLVRNRERVATKSELLDAVWGGAAVSESVLPGCIAAIRRAVGDDRSRGEVIQTVHGRGYRFVADVTERPSESAAARRREPADTPAAGETPFVGRDAARQRLSLALDSAFAGKGRLVLLVGEPGIGKTRTAEEFASEARTRGALAFFGRCHEGSGAPAFWPWAKMLREYARTADRTTLASDLGPGAAELCELVPELRELVGDVAAPRILDDDEQARFRLFESVCGFLVRASARQPLVLALDDLHWADDASLRLTRFLASELDPSRLVIVGLYREAEVRRGHPLASLLGELAGEPACERVPLRGLELEEVAQLVAGLGGEPAPAPLVATLHEMTDGNPFFIQEIVRLLIERGRLDAEQATPLALPQSVRDAIGRRLDGLSTSCNRMLHIAAVLGRDFSVALLGRVAELEPDDVLESIGEAVSAQLLVEERDSAGQYAFHHALVRQTLYDELETPERTRLHRRAGEALEASCGAHPEPVLAELAYHFFQAAVAGASDKAVDYCVRAARRALAVYAYDEAAQLLDRAVRAFELRTPREDRRHCELLLEYAGALAISGEALRAIEIFHSAGEIARRVGDAALLARSAIGSYELDENHPSHGSAHLEEALDAVGERHPALRSRLLSRLIRVPPWSHSMETRDELNREARRLAEQSGDADALRDAVLARHWACQGPDRIDDRLAVARELFELAERRADPSLAARGHDVLMGAHLLRGDVEAADRDFEAYSRIASELRQPALIFQAQTWEASRAITRGELDEAQRLIRGAFERGRRIANLAHFVYEGQMFFVRQLRGDEDIIEASGVFFGEMSEPLYSWQPAIRGALALAHADRGEVELARRELDALAHADFQDLGRDEHWLAAVGLFGLVSCAVSDTRRAALLYDLLTPYADLFMIHDLLRANLGSVRKVLGDLATLLGDHDIAADHFERAIASELAAKAPLAELASRASYAKLLLIRGSRGDRRRGTAMLEETRASWSRHGIRERERQRQELDALARRAAGRAGGAKHTKEAR